VSVCLRVEVLIVLCFVARGSVDCTLFCVWSVYDVGCTLWMQCLVKVSLVSSVYGVSMTLVVLCGCTLCMEYYKYFIHQGVSIDVG
jgi:hypothetical protein